MINNKKKTVEELAKEMNATCALSSEISEEEHIEYDAEYGYDYHEEGSKTCYKSVLLYND